MPGSANPEHIDSSDRSICLKGLMTVINAKAGQLPVEFHLNSTYVLMIVNISL